MEINSYMLYAFLLFLQLITGIDTKKMFVARLNRSHFDVALWDPLYVEDLNVVPGFGFHQKSLNIHQQMPGHDVKKDCGVFHSGSAEAEVRRGTPKKGKTRHLIGDPHLTPLHFILLIHIPHPSTYTSTIDKYEV